MDEGACITVLYTKFEIPDPQRPIPDDERGVLGPSGELIAFEPAPLDAAAIVDRVVDEVCPIAGTYGMGGPGFFALRFGEDWLVVALWGAADWLRARGRLIMDVHHASNARPLPWISEHGDELSPLLVGQRLDAIEVRKHSLQMNFDGGLDITLAESASDRPLSEGNQKPRAFSDDQDLRPSVFLAPTVELWV